MAVWLAQGDAERAAQQWYAGIVWILALGTLAVLLVITVAVVRRWARRQHDAIDRGKAHRRAARSAGRVDAWRAGAERYVDRDKLPEDEAMGGPGGAEELPSDGGGLYDGPPHEAASYEQEPDDAPDPYGLFKDKPYQDPDEDAFDDDLDDEDEEDDPDEGRR